MRRGEDSSRPQETTLTQGDIKETRGALMRGRLKSSAAPMLAARPCRIKLHTAPACQLHFNPGIKRLELGSGVVKVASFALCACAGTHLKSHPGCGRSPVISALAAPSERSGTEKREK